MYMMLAWILFAVLHGIFVVWGAEDVWKDVKCDEAYYPDNCDFRRIPSVTVEDYERCAPAELPLYVRNYYLGWAGQGVTYRDNRQAFRRIRIRPKMLRDISDNSLEITTLGQRISFPVGTAPSALQKLADPEGEKATAEAVADMGTVMIISSYSSTRIEELAAMFQGSFAHLWMQLHIFTNRNYTIDIVKRAEISGLQAIVLTVDSFIIPRVFCDAKNNPRIADIQLSNYPETFNTLEQDVTTLQDIGWLKSITKLPIVVKGILRGDDARMAVLAGASAVYVSNHGGRQIDGDIASIDALPEVVDAMNKMQPRRDVYLDGGIRNGFDVYKALARGAKMVFIGRPVLWGLTLQGEEGVKNVLKILQREFNETMLQAGASQPSEILRDTIIPTVPISGKKTLK